MNRVIYFLLFFVFAACNPSKKSTEPDLASRLSVAEQKWQDAKIKNYSFTYDTGGFVSPVHYILTVKDGAVADAKSTDHGITQAADTANKPTVESLFAEVQKAVSYQATSNVTATFGDSRGFPTKLIIAGGETIEWTVTNFVVN